jgi:hypothetical protein
MKGGDEAGREIARKAEIEIAEDIHEASVCDIAGKVADEDGVLDGVVDGAELLSNSSMGEGRTSPVDFDEVVGIWKENWVGRGSTIRTELVGDSEGGLWGVAMMKRVARVVGMTGWRWRWLRREDGECAT